MIEGDTILLSRAEKSRFCGARKSVLHKASSGEHCTPRNFVLLVVLQGTSSPHHVSYMITPHRAPNEISYGQMKQCNNLLQIPHVRERLSEKRKP